MLLLIFASLHLKENQCLDYILSRLLSHFLSNKHFFNERVTKFLKALMLKKSDCMDT